MTDNEQNQPNLTAEEIEEKIMVTDALNKKSWVPIYTGVSIFYVACSIWFGFAIKNANENGASMPSPFPVV